MIRRSSITLAAISCIILMWTALAQAQKSIQAADAKDHIGERATVCGQVASTHFAERSKGEPTFINLDKPYPNQIFTILIWGSDRAKFGDPERTYSGKHVCVTGRIASYRGVAEIIAYEPSQINGR